MANPKFVVQHFLVCQDAPWLGAPGPRTLRVLEGVGYYQTVPPDAEMPALDFWAYARMYLTNDVAGERRFRIAVYWLDAPGGTRKVQTFAGQPVRFSPNLPVVEPTFRIDQLTIPGRGRYEFRLLCRKRSPIHRVKWTTVKRDYLNIG